MTDTNAITTGVEAPRVEERAALHPRRVALDIWLLAERNLMKVWRNKRLIIFSTVQPIMQLILFAFVFGAIANLGDTGLSYKDFVVPAVIIQTMVFTGVQSGIGIADDLHTGMIDRFRSLPIARSAFLLGRTVSDTLRLAYQVILLLIAASIIGFRFHGGVLGAVAMPFVAVLFGMSLITFSEYMGLTVQDPETVQAAVFIPLLPLIFTSSAFAPVSRLPGWMQPIAGEPGHVGDRHRARSCVGRRQSLPREPGAPFDGRVALCRIGHRHHRDLHRAGGAQVPPGLTSGSDIGSRVRSRVSLRRRSGPLRCGPWPRTR